MQDQTIGVMHVNIEESEHAFRVNGVTYAKRHLLATMKKREDGDIHKTLARYLVIVPFLATAYTVAEDAPESIKYGAIKAKRLYEALELSEDNTVPFMLFAMSQAGENIKEIGEQVRKAGFYEQGTTPNGPFVGRERDEDNSSPVKPTLH